MSGSPSSLLTRTSTAATRPLTLAKAAVREALRAAERAGASPDGEPTAHDGPASPDGCGPGSPVSTGSPAGGAGAPGVAASADPGTSPAGPALADASPARRRPAEVRHESEFPYCAATLPSEAYAAVLAHAEARRFEARIAATGRRLATRLLSEAERHGTAMPEPLTAAAEAFAR
jgi:hypothetical protein